MFAYYEKRYLSLCEWQTMGAYGRWSLDATAIKIESMCVRAERGETIGQFVIESLLKRFVVLTQTKRVLFWLYDCRCHSVMCDYYYKRNEKKKNTECPSRSIIIAFRFGFYRFSVIHSYRTLQNTHKSITFVYSFVKIYWIGWPFGPLLPTHNIITYFKLIATNYIGFYTNK